MNMPKIILIGTHHHDPDGPQELRRMLRDTGPDIVVCEGSEAKLEGHEKYMELFRVELAAGGVDAARRRQWIEFADTASYEPKTCQEHCSIAQIPFFYFQDSGFVPTQAERRKSAKKAAKIYSRIDPQVAIQKMRRNSIGIYEELSRILGTPEEESVVAESIRDYYEYVGLRDAEMLAVFTELLGAYPGKSFACVMGFYHILSDPRQLSFYSRIKDFHPQRKVPRFDFINTRAQLGS